MSNISYEAHLFEFQMLERRGNMFVPVQYQSESISLVLSIRDGYRLRVEGAEYVMWGSDTVAFLYHLVVSAKSQGQRGRRMRYHHQGRC
ncbi:hypothetical protein HBI56_066400 [Parastagonospora nodorum]|uniref:Uncharacterized protein n=1 Tax=Phaeosphaeria nodorum (strain SN15 / ATCC MYA-4574 / FGSC 10173) TaxID=321614 RepID=A0A7U2HVD8_PHANO|nr:hypothetical protein HBH56_000990 [Parastagonospora nodorum]QRC90091.1 hypothetical protein JI435_400110 [Parastagonospora nodorum SN15]KAH3938137.1 hypothetical protein HBH54_001000 [Parastagonospora nodorum]KAH3958456.1 hypothetical protein HBH51_208830 [Parastagonospora nodorum]KAH3978221.1 hypothetical protein HBH52_109130 [Parastagonospora nodorum]